nr:hypothetical protein [Planktothrix serta]
MPLQIRTWECPNCGKLHDREEICLLGLCFSWLLVILCWFDVLVVL